MAKTRLSQLEICNQIGLSHGQLVEFQRRVQMFILSGDGDREITTHQIGTFYLKKTKPRVRVLNGVRYDVPGSCSVALRPPQIRSQAVDDNFVDFEVRDDFGQISSMSLGNNQVIIGSTEPEVSDVDFQRVTRLELLSGEFFPPANFHEHNRNFTLDPIDESELVGIVSETIELEFTNNFSQLVFIYQNNRTIPSSVRNAFGHRNLVIRIFFEEDVDPGEQV